MQWRCCREGMATRLVMVLFAFVSGSITMAVRPDYRILSCSHLPFALLITCCSVLCALHFDLYRSNDDIIQGPMIVMAKVD